MVLGLGGQHSASETHLKRWLEFITRHDEALNEIAETAGRISDRSSGSAPGRIFLGVVFPQTRPIPPSQMLVLLLKWNEFPLRGLTHGKAVGRGSKV